jgi:phosphoglycerol transferase MdoB-like AlkP superfamily enzyme
LALVARRTPVYEATHHLGRSEWVLPAEHWASQYSNASYAATFGVFNYHLSDLLTYARERTHRNDLSPTREAEILGVLTDKQGLNRRESPFRGLASGRSVVLIQMESWQHFVMDLRVGGVEVTPTLNRLKREGLSWDFIVDVTHLGRTSDAEFAVLTGLVPDTRGPAAFSGLEALPATLPRELAGRGYRTASFHGYNRAFWNRAYTHPVLGIDAMFFEESFEGQPKVGLGAADPVVFDFVAGKLEEWSGPTLAFVVSLSSHHPYVYTPPEYDGLFADLAADPSHGLLGPYLRSVRYADDALAGFVRALGERGLLERVVLVVYGDHDMGGIGARKPLESVGPRLFTPLEDRVPLVVWIPGAEEFVVANRAEFQGATGGLHDVFPTVLHLLGLEPPWGIEGTHLFVPDAARDPVPLPTPAGTFAFRQAIYGPFGAAPLGARPPPSHGVPTAERSLQDQLVVRDLLDLGSTRILGSIPPGPETASR